jgi:YrhK-like protein
MSRQRLMALCFAVGSFGFMIGPFPGYAQLVGSLATAWTFFISSIFFTTGGAIQSWLGWPNRRASRAGTAAWRVAIIQSAGTIFFNFTTYHAIHTATSNSNYDRLVWRPDAFGSVCFLISGAIAYFNSPRRGWSPVRIGSGWWQPSVNLLGCVFFGISAVAGYLVPSTGSVLNLAWSNWNTSLGAVCFLACAVGSLLARDESGQPERQKRLA